MQALRSGLSNSDQKLVDRLEQLKDDGKGPPPSESEIRQRLEKLKGDNHYVEGPSTQTMVCLYSDLSNHFFAVNVASSSFNNNTLTVFCS